VGLYGSAGFVEMEALPEASRCDRKFGMDLEIDRSESFY
jgi:hypothetical protein